MNIKKILIPLLLILFMASMAAFGAPVYVNVGPTTEFDGDIKILSEIVAEGTTADGWETTIFITDPTADRTITIPDADVTVGVVTGIVPPDHGGTGIANNVASTITITGAFTLEITLTANTSVTLPTSGIVVSDNNACTDIEGTGLSIAGGVLNWACTVNGIDSDNYTDGSIDHEHLAADVISGMTDVTSADADYILIWDATDSLLKKCDMGEVRGGAGGATPALDNLAAVQINTSLLSDTADTDSLGTATAEWLNLYIGDLGKIYCGLGQDTSIHRSAAGVMTLTAANGVVTSAALTVTGALGIGANNLTLTGYVGRDADNFLGFDVDNTLKIEINNVLHSIVSITTGLADNDKLATQGYVDDQVAGANVNLSNLGAVAINTSLLSDAADTDSLGSVDKEWLNLYIGEAGKIYLRLDQSVNLQATGAGILTITAANGVVISNALTVGGTLALVANSITMTGSIGVTGSRVTKLWATDLEVTNAIAGSITGTARGLVSVANADITIQPNGTGDTRIYAPCDVVTTKSGVATLTIAEAGTVLVSAAAGYTLTLPTAVGHSGLRYHFIKTDYNYNLITLDGDGTETFNYENSTGTPNLTYPRLNTPLAQVTIVSDGSNWQVGEDEIGQVPYFCAYLGANYDNIQNALMMRVTLDTEEYDIGSNYDNSNWVTGTADGTVANHLQDDGESQFTAAMLYYRVKNTTDSTYAYITTFNDAGDVTLSADIFVNGEAYEIKKATFTVPVSGEYLIDFQGYWYPAVADKSYRAGILKNGAVVSKSSVLNAAVAYFGCAKTTFLDFDKDDAIIFYVKAASDENASDLYGTAIDHTYMKIRLISKD